MQHHADWKWQDLNNEPLDSEPDLVFGLDPAESPNQLQLIAQQSEGLVR